MLMVSLNIKNLVYGQNERKLPAASWGYTGGGIMVNSEKLEKWTLESEQDNGMSEIPKLHSADP